MGLIDFAWRARQDGVRNALDYYNVPGFIKVPELQELHMEIRAITTDQSSLVDALNPFHREKADVSINGRSSLISGVAQFEEQLPVAVFESARVHLGTATHPETKEDGAVLYLEDTALISLLGAANAFSCFTADPARAVVVAGEDWVVTISSDTSTPRWKQNFFEGYHSEVLRRVAPMLVES